MPQKHAFSALKPSDIQTQEYDSHGYRVQASKVATSSLDVNVDPGIQSQRRHDGYPSLSPRVRMKGAIEYIMDQPQVN